ncbi:MAG: hypothetical protein H6573_00170 [Lewinellaceae bacterium]|nr:hypothetical protein [Phaeodactylibacter sp.]MCB0559742.1 hypothetical protein [Phaeodactylibacter sp.]MCB0616362.1 hypothetical protein [Phaeodactylibacter sp.]MCB9345911.1 hypothetical protein [Lewinellaceae bacterium]
MIKELSAEFGVSATQAYRYVQQARQNQGLVPIPAPKEVFTVKLAPGLIEQIRSFSQAKGISISGLVSQALKDFLKQKGDGQEKGQQGG